MESKMVYNSLMEIFPQVDSRVLRAVAIEHSKDVDAAVEAVLQEIIPFFVEVERQRSDDACSTWSDSDDESSEASECALVRRQDVDGSSLNDEHHEELYETQLVMPEKLNENKMKMSAVMYTPGESIVLTDKIRTDAPLFELSSNLEKLESVSGYDRTDSTTENISCPTGETLHEMARQHEELSGNLQTDCTASNEENVLGNAFADENNFSDRNSTSQVPNIYEGDLGNILGANIATDNVSKMVAVVSDDPNAATSQVSQIQAIEVLEEVITNARNSKGTLSSALESVLRLIQEVELKQEVAKKAKEEAAEGGAHILKKVEDLKQMLQHAKEANDMYSGDVYGEKAILATELKEVQNRVLSLLDEKDKALGILDEMRQTLEERLDAALEVINSSEQEKLDKEMAAQKLYADQELVMEKVAQESKILKQQAEENSKLQEFLSDRGRLLDMLHGEMAVICQDVKLLKEKFDNGLPLSKSLYSSHSSSFILASSNFPSKPLIPDQAKPVLDRYDSMSDSIKEGRDPEEETARNDQIDYGWDIVD